MKITVHGRTHAFFGLVLGLTAAGLALPAQAKDEDPRVKSALNAEKVPFEITTSKDYRVSIDYTDDKRSQTVFINSATSDYRGTSWRDVYSIAFSVKGALSAEQANMLLADNSTNVFGFWCTEAKNGTTTVYYQTAIEADASPKALHNAFSLVASTADIMEKKIIGKDEN